MMGATNIQVGTINLWHDPTSLYVQYDLLAGYQLADGHVCVSTATFAWKAPGQCPYNAGKLAAGKTTYTFVIPWSGIGFKSAPCDIRLYLQVHATVNSAKTGREVGGAYAGTFKGIISYSGFTAGCNATNVLGQVDFTTNTTASPATQSGMFFPAGSAYDAAKNRLFVSDSFNNRVLVYDSATITDGEPAIHVLGQPDFTSSTWSTTQSGMSSPFGITYDATNQRLFVADANNFRVLVYDVSSITDGEPAINVLGQPDFTSHARVTTQSGMFSPIDVAYDATDQRLFVADYGRVLIYNVATITDGMNATNVLGQADFTSNTSATTQSGMSIAEGVEYDEANQRLFVADYGNGRVLVYDVTTISDGEPAINVLGQPNFTTRSNFCKHCLFPAPTQSTLLSPIGVTYDAANQRLFVSDTFNNRVIVYDVATITDGELAIDVLGQPNFTTRTNGTTQAGMLLPEEVDYDVINHRLYVADRENNRVLVYDF